MAPRFPLGRFRLGLIRISAASGPAASFDPLLLVPPSLIEKEKPILHAKGGFFPTLLNFDVVLAYPKVVAVS